MPQKNVRKQFIANQSYHLYNRAVAGCELFKDSIDYSYFLKMIDRYLGTIPHKNSSGYSYPKLNDKIEINAFCLMPNHFHLLIHQFDEDAITDFCRRILTSYSKYYNLRYKRSGALFETAYKASMIDNEPYLMYISKYIHRNPSKITNKTEDFLYSSFSDYLSGNKRFTWLHTRRVLSLFDDSIEGYKEFVNDTLKSDF